MKWEDLDGGLVITLDMIVLERVIKNASLVCGLRKVVGRYCNSCNRNSDGKADLV